MLRKNEAIGYAEKKLGDESIKTVKGIGYKFDI